MILLGITGGIAAYKSVELARLFIRKGYEVQVVMTPAASHFVTPLTFKTLTRRAVYIDQFINGHPAGVEHIALASPAEILVVAPTTANTLGKFAAGIADNLLTTLFMALKSPALIVPSMNDQMYCSAAVQHNLTLLRNRGYHVLDPVSGELACGTVGTGRMPEAEDIYNFTRFIIGKKDYLGIKVLVTAGPTREYLDPVRFLSNPSTGLMGYSLAEAFARRGAEVILISGPVNLAPPQGIKLIPVITAEQMFKAVLEHYPTCQVVVKAAAVADFRPPATQPKKIKKSGAGLTLTLTANPDILKTLGAQKGKHILVGFAAETGPAVEQAKSKLINKNLDLIVANDLTVRGAGFASATNKVSIVDASGHVEELPLMDKEVLADRIADRIAGLLPLRCPR